jgi:hypothetical protein
MINYKLIDESISFYETVGFKRIESPWTVTKNISDITNPTGKDFTIKEKNKVLVASGEQSFLYLYNKGFLPKGRFQTTTPCYRDESFDEYHTKYFIKNELIITDTVNMECLDLLVETAALFFNTHINDNKYRVTKLKTGDESYDLMLNGIEVGSYGIRSCSYLNWIYGTGLAEPRFSKILWDITNKK